MPHQLTSLNCGAQLSYVVTPYCLFLERRDHTLRSVSMRFTNFAFIIIANVVFLRHMKCPPIAPYLPGLYYSLQVFVRDQVVHTYKKREITRERLRLILE